MSSDTFDTNPQVTGAAEEQPPRLYVVKPRKPDTDAAPEGDAEIYTEQAADLGDPVDLVDVAPGLSWGDLTATSTRGRAPLVPLWLQSADSRRATFAAIGENLRYWALFHLIRSPKYAAKTAWYAPIGAGRLVGKVIHWASAEEGNWQLRQQAANSNDPHTWQALDRTRSKQARARWWLVIPSTIGLTVSLAVVHATGTVPTLGWYATMAAAVVLLARVGRPADKPITDRVSNAPRFTKLTADMVRNAFTSLGFSPMKDPGSLEFVHPGIHRDGPGWLARVNLPAGLEAVKVLEKRGALSSALRLPVDQVWPAPGPQHAGQVDLWVGYRPASEMGKPHWPLADPAARTSYFEAQEFGVDQRQRPVKIKGFAMNFLIGGRPGSGKSYAGRSIVTTFALDPTVELKIAEYKGTGDFLDMAPLCSTYVCGLADEDFAAGLAMLNWGLAEAERRGQRIKDAYVRGEAPERKVTPELAAKPGSGLHPVVIVIDEAHELFGDSTVGKEAGLAAERLAKRGRALGITLVIITQIPDKDSLPTGITRNIGIRWCLAVPDQVANDMILGTGAYKRGITGTVYRPEIDAGWGVLTGLAEPTAVRNHFPTPEVTAQIIARATALRGGTVVGDAVTVAAARDLLADLLAVAASNGQHWDKAAPALAERWPEAYPAMSQDTLSELARARGLASVDVKVAGRTRKGYKLTDLRAVIADAETAAGDSGTADEPDDDPTARMSRTVR